jgi:Nuclease-related domain
VRTIELSNHPADALRIARQRRAGSARQGQAELAEVLARHQLLVRRAANARDGARAQRRWLTWLRATLAVRRLRRLAPRAPLAASAPPDAQERLAAGVAGEQQVAREFGRALGDDWVLVRGYCNRRGEIDHLLLGPPGLIAVESKHLNATVSCDGDDWRFEKFDRYGNLVERGALADRGGRSPSVQLNEPAMVLEEFLSSRHGPISILRVVLLTHPNSRRGSCRKPTVHITTSATALASQLNEMPPVLSAAQRARLEELITRDHRYHEARRPTRRPPSASRPRGARTDRSARSASR